MKSLFLCNIPVIGMVHLKALPGSPFFSGKLEEVVAAAREDVFALQNGGVNGLLFENFNDVPFFPDTVPAETIAGFAALVAELKQEISLPFGINVLRNDGAAAVAIATATGAQFIRVNVFNGATVTDQGVLQSKAHAIVRLKHRLNPELKIFADVQVKHGAPLIKRPVAEEAQELIERSCADAVICSGTMTGAPVDRAELEQIKKAVPKAAIILGSGVDAENIASLLSCADAMIVGTAFKKDGKVTAQVDEARVKNFMRLIQEKE
ncbi:MAG: phosphorybosylanthranilate isomerase [Calditrichaeota bacterium]|nr:MAG: phosphorybosylanthranilate isomerase [Calditrichota bacterium]